MQGTVGGVTTTYIGNYYEWTGEITTTVKYYYAGATRLAMRVGNGTQTEGLYWLLSDHLGSTAVTADSAGNPSGEVRYKAWGETRFTSGSIPTTFRFTGQRQEEQLGLYFYNARWYDPALGRFIQADTIVPDPYNSQSFDRYAYVFNNPVKFFDPTGHVIRTPMVEGTCTPEACGKNSEVLDNPGIKGASKIEENEWWGKWGWYVDRGNQAFQEYAKYWYEYYNKNPLVYLGDSTNNIDNIPFSVIAADFYAANIIHIMWLPHANVLGAPEMAGGSQILNGISGIDVGIALIVPSWVRNANTFMSWAEQLQKQYQKTGVTLAADDLDEFVKLARSYNVSVRQDPGHIGQNNPWTMPHLNVGDKQNWHIPIPSGWRLP